MKKELRYCAGTTSFGRSFAHGLFYLYDSISITGITVLLSSGYSDTACRLVLIL